MLSLPRRCMASVWDCPSAAPSLNRMAAACGLPTIIRVAQAFVSPFPPKARPMNETRGRGSAPAAWCRFHIEMEKRPLGLRAPINIGRDFDLSHAVGFNAGASRLFSGRRHFVFLASEFGR